MCQCRRVGPSCEAKLNLSSSFFSAQASGMGTPLVAARWSVRAPTAVLPSLPGLLLAEAVGSAICSIAIPARVYLAWCANQLLTVRFSCQLLSIFWQVYPESSAVRVGTWSLIRLHEQQCHLLVDAVVFGDGGVWAHHGRASSGWVHVLDEVGVVGLI
jgi:hypothetical protein